MENNQINGNQLIVPETASLVLSAQVKALVEARFIVTERKPRDIDKVRQEMLKECKRKFFAEVAVYKRPVGKNPDGTPKIIEGPSIRFAESAIRCMGNIVIDTNAIFDDNEKRIIRVSASDIQANTTYSIDVTVRKQVERKKLRWGEIAISKRINSQNETTYTVEASDDEVMVKQAALISKAIRTIGLRLIPGDIIDECMDIVKTTQSSADKADPGAAKNKIIDAFADINVTVDMLKDYLGFEIGMLTPKGLLDLRHIYTALKEGETSWKDLIDSKEDQKKEPTNQEKNIDILPSNNGNSETEEPTKPTKSKPEKKQKQPEQEKVPEPIQQIQVPVVPFVAQDNMSTAQNIVEEQKPQPTLGKKASLMEVVAEAQRQQAILDSQKPKLSTEEAQRIDKVDEMKDLCQSNLPGLEKYLKYVKKLPENSTLDDTSLGIARDVVIKYKAYLIQAEKYK